MRDRERSEAEGFSGFVDRLAGSQLPPGVEKGSRRIVTLISIVTGSGAVILALYLVPSALAKGASPAANIVVLAVVGASIPWFMFFAVKWVIQGFQQLRPVRVDLPIAGKRMVRRLVLLSMATAIGAVVISRYYVSSSVPITCLFALAGALAPSVVFFSVMWVAEGFRR